MQHKSTSLFAILFIKIYNVCTYLFDVSDESESLRSGTPVKSDISGTGSVSGYGTGDSGSDKTPPYLPTSRPPAPPPTNFATLGHHHKMGISANPLDMSYAHLTLPHSQTRAGSPHAQQLHHSNQQQQQYHHSSPPRIAIGDNKVIYSQIDVNRKGAGGGQHASTKIANAQ